MIHHLVPLAKRAAEEHATTELPWWALLIVLVDLIILLPIILVVSYTLKNVFPILTIIEEQNPPPSYEPLSLNEDAPSAETNDPEAAAASANTNKNDHPGSGGRPVTSSLRATWTLLRSTGGYRALFRGFWPLVATAMAQGFVFAVASTVLPAPLAVLVAALATVQLSTAWVHVVATPRPGAGTVSRSFFRRLPRFGRTFVAVGPAMALYAVAEQVAQFMPLLVARLAGIPFPDANNPFSKGGRDQLKDIGDMKAGPAVAMVVAGVLPYFLIVVPAFAILVRVQASLLPADEHAIVPFDRSFGGKVEPEVVSGKGFATMRQAWSSFGLASWKRLYFVFFKLFLVDMALMFVILAVIVPEFLVLRYLTGAGGKEGEVVGGEGAL